MMYGFYLWVIVSLLIVISVEVATGWSSLFIARSSSSNSCISYLGNYYRTLNYDNGQCYNYNQWYSNSNQWCRQSRNSNSYSRLKFSKDLEIPSTVNSKQLLQEIGQYLFSGCNPIYKWNSNDTLLTISFCDQVNYQQHYPDNPTGKLLKLYIKKNYEYTVAEEAIEYLKQSRAYGSTIKSWLAQRLNKDNSPKIIPKSALIQETNGKSLVVLVDAENVPDFKKNFYVDSNGYVKFSSQSPPQPRKAPSLTDDFLSPNYLIADSIFQDRVAFSSEENNKDYNSQLVSRYRSKQFQRTYNDEEIIILVYAHSRSKQCAWANRITTSTRKDAADCKYMYRLQFIFGMNL